MASYPVPKQLLDKSVSLLLLVVLAPVYVIVIAAMGIDMLFSSRDRGRFLYRERRVSRGREFDLLKFRTLRRDVLERVRSEESHARLHEGDEQNLTWAGRRVLKPWYLDELPQLWNVLRGDMSLVGPRPWPVAMVEKQVAQGYVYRNHVLAGWTGPAQVSKDSPKRSQATEFDLEYVEACRTMSAGRLLRYDLKLLAESVATMLRGRGLKY